MKPYYQDEHVTIYHGDCREIMPHLKASVCITDPVWPNAIAELAGSDDPLGLFRGCLEVLPSVDRLVVWLGCQSDPRFLEVVPDGLPFLRASYLRWGVPSYNGRCLVSGDILYAFGSWPKPCPGRMVIPGEVTGTSKHRLKQRHPCARNESHAKWVVKFWCEDDDVLIDPFCGSGTILRAAKDQSVTAIGIEIEERFCEVAANRMRQGVLLEVGDHD